MLVDLTVKEFLNKVAGSDPVPGGGSIAALNGAVASALAAMVANLTIGKKNYEEHEELMNHIASLALREKDVFIADIDRDSEAYDAVFACFKMPKATDEEKAARKEAMQKALKEATLVPYHTMELCLESLKVVEMGVGCTNTSAASDLGVASLNLKAAVQGAWLNVLINLAGIRDEAFVSEYREKGEQILKEALPLADKIYTDILNSL